MNTRTRLAFLATGLLTIAPAFAQTAAPSQSGRSDNLSRKLSESDGVIKPKENIDPGMKVPAPDPRPHSTPVIPPSATGGDTAK